MKYTITNGVIDDEWKDFSSKWNDVVTAVIKNRIDAKEKLAELDALINGGLLVTVGSVYGKELYIRLDHRDPERSNAELSRIRDLLYKMLIERENPLYALPEASKYIGLSAVTLRRYIKLGKLHAIKVGKEYRVKQSDLEGLKVAV